MLGNLEAAVKRIGTQERIGVKELAAAEISFLQYFRFRSKWLERTTGDAFAGLVECVWSTK